jgi:hypothetical protein
LRGEEPRELVVSADVALFTKHRVGIQEGPALSLRLLSADPNSSRSALTELDMQAHLARRSAEPLRGKKRNPESGALSSGD